MKNTMKKLTSVLLAAVMILAMSITTFAADQTGTNGTITITNATVGQTYTAYKLFEANPDGNNVAYTASAATKAAFEALEGNPFEFTSNAAGTYNVSVKDGKKDADVITFLQSFVTKNDDEVIVSTDLPKIATLETKTATTAEVKWENVPYGYYLVASSLGATVTVDKTNRNATIIDKNQGGPSWDDKGKTIVNSDIQSATVDNKENSTANFGDVVNYKISINTTNYDGAKKILNYYVKDAIDAGLTYEGNIVVKVGETTLTKDTDYTLTMNPDNQGFEIDIPWNLKYASPNKITVTYSAKVTNTAVIAGDGNKNTANFTYKTEDDEEKKPYDETNKKTTTTYTYALGIDKVDATTKAALSGAHFSIAGIKAVATDVAGVYNYDDNGTVTEFVTNDAGIIVIKGVKAGTYVATETQAPAGYNLLTETKDITAAVESTSSYTTTITKHYNADGELVDETVEGGKDVTTSFGTNVTSITVENNTGSTLPSTGGMGTTILYVIGAILVLGAGVVLVARKRTQLM